MPDVLYPVRNEAAVTKLTLIVVPVAYSYLDDLGGWFSRRFGKGKAISAAEAESSDGASGAVPTPAWGD